MPSQRVEDGLYLAYSEGKYIIPLLVGITFDEVCQRKPDWAFILRTAVAIPVSSETVSKITPRIIRSLQSQGILPDTKILPT